jgi:colanic acid biosynthesis glycosyl transferase WcaI
MIVKESPIPKRILLITQYFSPEPIGIGKINGEMMAWLAANGYECSVITNYPSYPHWKVQAPYKNGWYKKEVTKNGESGAQVNIYRCPSYVPSKPSGMRRILQDFSFSSSVFWQVLKFNITRQKFDLIVTVAPPFHLAHLGFMLKRLNGGRILYHIQDLQIDAAQDLKMLSNEKLFNLIYKIEKNILLKSDYVSGIAPGMIQKIKAKVDREVFYFPNWADTSSFYPISARDKLKVKWGCKEDDIVFLYSGAIGEKQGLETILLTAEDLLGNKKIRFIICGSGPYKEKLMLIAKEKGLLNIDFLPIQDKEVFNEFLNMADYHLILQKSNASDLVMPSKFATILAVGGISIVTTSPGTSLYNLTKDNDLGYILEPENHHALTGLINEIKSDDHSDQKRENVRNYAIKHLNIDNVMSEFVDRMLK